MKATTNERLGPEGREGGHQLSGRCCCWKASHESRHRDASGHAAQRCSTGHGGEGVIEMLRLDVPASHREIWLQAEASSWQPWLEQQPGFEGRELFWDPEREEGLLLIRWSSREQWKAIPSEEVDQVQEVFEARVNQALGVDQVQQRCSLLLAEGEPRPQALPSRMIDARLDLKRRQRLGMVEAVWGEHKTADQIIAILRRFRPVMSGAGDPRVAEKAGVRQPYGADGLVVHADARCRPLANCHPRCRSSAGGGAQRWQQRPSVVAEAALALRCHGIARGSVDGRGGGGFAPSAGSTARLGVRRCADCLRRYGRVLPTVLAGLVPQPIIAVPVSVGYGISAGGRTALEGMLASCAPGLTVVIIDNGYGAAMAALRILRGR